MVLLWIRQEVMQLVTPQLAASGKQLNSELVTSAIRRLAKAQTPEGRISYDRWLVVGKDVLKWNECCILVFWDLLVLASKYLRRISDGDALISSDSASEGVWDANPAVDLNVLAIFLGLHIDDASTRPPSPKSEYDTRWPSQYQEDVFPTASALANSGAHIKLPSPSSASGSPKSPRSPRALSLASGTSSSGTTNPLVHGSSNTGGSASSGLFGSSGAPVSPSRRHMVPGAATSPGAHQNHSGSVGGISPNRASASSMSSSVSLRSNSILLHALRQKLPLILRIIALEDVPEDSPEAERFLLGGEWDISRRAFDALGLVIAGGVGKDRECDTLSSLFSSEDLSSSFSGAAAFQWLDSHLSTAAAEMLSPQSTASVGSPPRLSPRSPRSSVSPPQSPPKVKGSGLFSLGLNTSSSSLMLGGTPIPLQLRTIAICSEPTASETSTEMVIALPNSTPMHSATVNGKHNPVLNVVSCDLLCSSRPSAIHNVSTTIVYVVDCSSGSANPSGGAVGFSKVIDGVCDLAMDDSRRGLGGLPGLPSLVIQGCSFTSIYLLAPYASVNITNCTDCEIVIGAVAVGLIFNNCERIQVSTVCRKAIVTGCEDCLFNLACLSPSLLSGENKDLMFGPSNLSYRHHRAHLQLAGLGALCSEAARDAVNVPGALRVDYWNVIWDLIGCMEAPAAMGSPSGYALDAAANLPSMILKLPAPSQSVAMLQPADRFTFVAIPYRAEHQTPSLACIPLDEAYQRGMLQRRDKLDMVRQSIESKTSKGADGLSEGSKGVGDALRQQFMDWLVETGRAQHVLDLIKLDAERAGINECTIEEAF